ncbi:SCAN domain-containing protein 1, partial [Myotis brandtii]
PGRNPVNPLVFRQMFRKLRCEDPSRPREVFRHLVALTRQWLRPDTHTKEQMIEMLVQEQFQIILREMLRAQQQKCPSWSDTLAESHCSFLAQPT